MEKKSFFELLDGTSALILGLVGGVLTLGTIGFLVLGAYVLKANLPAKTLAVVGGQANPNTQLPPPPNVPKAARPKIELFVMTYCPYGLQTQKGLLGAWALLKDKADIDVKFVSYAMHGQKEVEENTRQYCLEKNSPDKYRAYLQCFTTSGDAQSCLTQTNQDQNALNSCITATNNQFKITALYNDKSTWLGGQYPVYPIHDALNKQYGVQGSPTLVVNGVAVDSGRSAEALKQLICNSFTKPPAECGQTLSANTYQPGFGMQVDGSAANAQVGCGT